MPELEPDSNDELRAAFEGFRAQALGELTPPSVDAVRGAARHRHRVHTAVAGAVAALTLLAGSGAGWLLTHQEPAGHRRVATASSEGARVSVSPHGRRSPSSSSRPAPDGSPHTPAGRDEGGNGSTRQVSVKLAADPVPLPDRAGGVYHGAFALTVRNTGDVPIPQTRIEFTMPPPLSFTGDGDKIGTCLNGSCVVQILSDLPPGASRTISGTLSYRARNRSAGPATESGTVRVTAQDSGGTEVAVQSQSFTVLLGQSPSPSTKPSPSDTPSPTPSDPQPTG